MAIELSEGASGTIKSGDKISPELMKEQFFESILTNIKDYAIYLIDNEGRITFWNNGAEKILGYTSSEVVGAHFSMFYTKEDRDNDLPARLLKEALQKGRTEIEGWRIGKHDDKFWANVTITPNHDDNGEITGYVKITRDLSERMAAEQVINEYELNLLEQAKHTEKLKELYFSFISAVEGYAIFMLDENGMVLDWNKGAEKIKGYKPEEIIGRHFSTFYTEEDKKTAFYQKLLLKARREGLVQHEGWRVRKDGSRLWANVTITALRDNQGMVTGFTKITKDLSAAKKAEREAAEYTTRLEMEIEKVNNRDEQLKNAYEKLQKTAKVRSKFLEAAASDMQAPLNNIINNIQALKEMSVIANDVSAVTKVDSVLWSANVSKKSIKDLALMSALLEESVSVSPENIDLDGLISKIINSDNRTYKIAQKINYRSTGDINIYQSALHLEYILENILLNAAMYAPEHSSITLSVDCDGTNCIITVEDEGPGILEEEQARLFENFFRGSNVRNKEGSGLSLSNSKKLAQLMDGDISYAYQPGKGSVFTVSTPQVAKA